MREINQALLDKGLARIDKSLNAALERGRLGAEERDAARARIRGTTALDEFAGCATWSSEAATENLEIKRQTFAELDAICPQHTILTTNTRSIPVIQVATATARPDRVMGTHFFNPVPVMRLLELVRALTTSDQTLETMCCFGESLGKRMIVSKDPGRLHCQLPARAIHAGRDSDGRAGLCLTRRHRPGDDAGHQLSNGPADVAGLRRPGHHPVESPGCFFDEFKEPRFAAPTVLSSMVAAGWHGRKTGRGF